MDLQRYSCGSVEDSLLVLCPADLQGLAGHCVCMLDGEKQRLTILKFNIFMVITCKSQDNGISLRKDMMQ